ncbi:flagellar hook-basal body complex protein FliE [Georgenia sp. 311]|uniref:Flagellar hook-basal body complex protein FliE n=1 Tax=Georgenia wutianyii TaxID=2585135 RepID=A0ABX5VJ98_9MICO|nr:MULTISPECIES: flagellar hook-basal body complex protein FliE [Georgenia]QDB78165.1 flagellar hook-basal body complex protein FliE [Georgenia wutianyii]TNC21260.1 flagellar hook-basal body complex protein FliE [Georgenia sp. 311]
MSVPAISTVTSVAPAGYLDGLEAGGATGGDGGAFGAVLASAVDGVSAKQATSSELALKAVTGDLEDIHDYTIAATEAAVALELTVALRNKAVDAFNEIMRMQA